MKYYQDSVDNLIYYLASFGTADANEIFKGDL